MTGLLNISLVYSVLTYSSGNLNGQWNQYSAVWEGKPGTMMVNMDLHDLAPSPDLGHLVEISNLIYNCDEQGYPAPAEMQRVETQFEDIHNELTALTYTEYAGRFIYQCVIKDYLYMNDTTGVKNLLDERTGINSEYKIKRDPDWKIYMDFMYPDDYLVQTMVNGKIIKILEKEGFDLSSRIALKHFAGFPSEHARNKYRTFLLEQNFKIIDRSETQDEFPFQISFSRKDRLYIDQLSNITLRLHKKAEFLEGKYEGWEVEY